MKLSLETILRYHGGNKRHVETHIIREIRKGAGKRPASIAKKIKQLIRKKHLFENCIQGLADVFHQIQPRFGL